MTTAYHPSSNGMVERFHRQLKAALLSHENPSWSADLPLFLFDIRSLTKDDFQWSASENVFDAPIQLPGKYFCPSLPVLCNPSQFVDQLHDRMSRLRPIPLGRSPAPNI